MPSQGHVDEDFLCFLPSIDNATVLPPISAMCSVCQRVCRPSAFARTTTLDSSACFARSVVDKAARGCLQHQAVLKWQRRRNRKPARAARRVARCLSSLESYKHATLKCVGSYGEIRRMEHPSVYTCEIGMQSLGDVRSMFESLEEHQLSCELRCRPKNLVFHVERPSWVDSDIIWVSAKNAVTFGYFRSLWAELDVATILSSLGEMLLFAGYFVARRLVRNSHFHTDFSETGDSAFTFMTPLYDMSELTTCQLIGETAQGTKQYRYKLGQAILFGEDFIHSTEPGDAPNTVVFLCFVLGRKGMTPPQWANTAAYIESQCPVYQNLDGDLVKSTT